MAGHARCSGAPSGRCHRSQGRQRAADIPDGRDTAPARPADPIAGRETDIAAGPRPVAASNTGRRPKPSCAQGIIAYLARPTGLSAVSVVGAGDAQLATETASQTG